MARVVPSVYASRELRAVVVSMKAVPREVRRAIASHTRREFGPVWKQEVQRRPDTRLEQRVFGGAGTRIAGTNPPTLVAGGSTRKLPGGLVPADDVRSVEFGTQRPNRRATWDRRSPAGRTHKVKGWPERQLEVYKRGGQVVYPAFKAIAPRIVSLWVQTVYRKVYDAVRGEL